MEPRHRAIAMIALAEVWSLTAPAGGRQLLAEALGPPSAAETEQAAGTLLRVQDFMLRATADLMRDGD